MVQDAVVKMPVASTATAALFRIFMGCVVYMFDYQWFASLLVGFLSHLSLSIVLAFN